MKEYTCQICNFKSNLKSNYKRHLNTKKHQNKEKELGNDLGKKNKNPHKSAQILTNSPQILTNPHKSSQIQLKNTPVNIAEKTLSAPIIFIDIRINIVK